MLLRPQVEVVGNLENFEGHIKVKLRSNWVIWGENIGKNLQSWSTLVVINSSPSGDNAANVISAGSFFLKNKMNWCYKK